MSRDRADSKDDRQLDEKLKTLMNQRPENKCLSVPDCRMQPAYVGALTAAIRIVHKDLLTLCLGRLPDDKASCEKASMALESNIASEVASCQQVRKPCILTDLPSHLILGPGPATNKSTIADLHHARPPPASAAGTAPLQEPGYPSYAGSLASEAATVEWADAVMDQLSPVRTAHAAGAGDPQSSALGPILRAPAAVKASVPPAGEDPGFRYAPVALDVNLNPRLQVGASGPWKIFSFPDPQRLAPLAILRGDGEAKATAAIPPNAGIRTVEKRPKPAAPNEATGPGGAPLRDPASESVAAPARSSAPATAYPLGETQRKVRMTRFQELLESQRDRLDGFLRSDWCQEEMRAIRVPVIYRGANYCTECAGLPWRIEG